MSERMNMTDLEEYGHLVSFQILSRVKIENILNLIFSHLHLVL